eukprot:3825537-Amphidinium_carterae.1
MEADASMTSEPPAVVSLPAIDCDPLMVYTGNETLPMTCCFCEKTKQTWALLFQHIRLDHRRTMKSMAGTVVLDEAKSYIRQRQKPRYEKKKVKSQTTHPSKKVKAHQRQLLQPLLKSISFLRGLGGSRGSVTS